MDENVPQTVSAVLPEDIQVSVNVGLRDDDRVILALIRQDTKETLGWVALNLSNAIDVAEGILQQTRDLKERIHDRKRAKH